jgi:hypothetical protein
VVVPHLTTDGFQPCIAAALAGEGWNPGDMMPQGAAWLELKIDGSRRRQLADLRLVLSGVAKKSEMHVYRQSAGGQTHGTQAVKAPGGGQRRMYRTMVRFIFTAPHTPKPAGENTILLRSCPDRFIAADREEVQADDGKFYEHSGDHVRRFEAAIAQAVRLTGRTWDSARDLIERHETFRGRHALDRWHEGRVDAGQKRHHKDMLEARCAKQRERIKTYILQQCAAVARVCRNRRVGCVIIDLAERGYFRSFPWHAMRARLAHVLTGMGVNVADRTGPTAAE